MCHSFASILSNLRQFFHGGIFRFCKNALYLRSVVHDHSYGNEVFREMSPFCSNFTILLNATPDFSATCSRVRFFSIRLLQKSLAIALVMSSVLSGV